MVNDPRKKKADELTVTSVYLLLTALVLVIGLYIVDRDSGLALPALAMANVPRILFDRQKTPRGVAIGLSVASVVLSFLVAIFHAADLAAQPTLNLTAIGLSMAAAVVWAWSFGIVIMLLRQHGGVPNT
jgi:hypothetical protein